DFMNAFIPDIHNEKEQLNTPVAELKKFEGTFIDLRLEAWKSVIQASGDGKLMMEDTLFGKIEFVQVGTMTFVDTEGRELIFKGSASDLPHYFKYRNVGYSVRSEEKLFADVPKDHAYAAAIYSLRDFNIFKDVAESFRPEDNITRAEFVAYFMRLQIGR